LTEERRPDAYIYEDTIDLRPYIKAIFARWWLIVLCAIFAGGAAFAFSILRTPMYEATARVVTLRSQAEISLGSNIETMTEGDINLAEAVQGMSERRLAQRLNSMAGLVQNGAIAQQVSAELEGELTEEERDPSELLTHVEGQVLELASGEFTGSDTILINVEYDDPEKASAIANAWARNYETYVNQIYGEASVAPFTDISSQVVEAEAEYDTARDALLAFLEEQYDVVELQRQIEEEQGIIIALRTGRQTAISALVNEDVKTKQALITAYFEEDVNDLIFALSRKQKLDNLLTEARLMRAQLDEGEDLSAASTGLSLLALKSQVFSAVKGLPFGTLDLQVDSIANLNSQQGADAQIADLDALIAAMKEEVAALEAFIAKQAANLDTTQLRGRTGEAVNDLLHMDAYKDVVGSSVAETPLSQEIARREAGIRQLQVEIERLNSRKTVLEKDRDLAWLTYDALLSKQQELDVAAGAKGTEVRFAATAVPPSEPVDTNAIRNTVLAALIGLMMGTGLVMFAKYMDTNSTTMTAQS
jgi:uncharacterized protein involved in exopolysaccharide biosynthesis